MPVRTLLTRLRFRLLAPRTLEQWQTYLRASPSGASLERFMTWYKAQKTFAFAVCRVCGRKMEEDGGCVAEICVEGQIIHRIPFDGDQRHHPDWPHPTCHDCNCAVGSYHHEHCDCEVCPTCGEQWIACPHKPWAEKGGI